MNLANPLRARKEPKFSAAESSLLALGLRFWRLSLGLRVWRLGWTGKLPSLRECPTPTAPIPMDVAVTKI